MKTTKIRQSARGMTCIRCGAPPDTVRACHYNGIRQHLYGKGRGIKANDLMTAELCASCDAIYSEGTTEGFESKIDRSESFLHLVCLTNIRRFERGLIKV